MDFFDITALGELLVDFTPAGLSGDGIALFARNPGGAPANVLAMHAGLGGKTAFIGKVGDDAFGLFLERTLLDAGIDVRGLVKSREFLTTLAFVQLSETGERSFSFYRKDGADLMLASGEVDRSLIDRSAVFHFGSLSLSGEPCRSALGEAVRYAKSRGTIISFDPNFRAPLWDSAGEAKSRILPFVSEADILKVSEEEMNLLTGEADIERGGETLAGMGPAIVLVSLGAGGAWYFCGGGRGRLPAYGVKTADTTGAGDAFLGAALFRLRGKTREELRSIDRGELADIVDFANAAGGLTAAKPGAIPAMPDMAEIEHCRARVPRLD